MQVHLSRRALTTHEVILIVVLVLLAGFVFYAVRPFCNPRPLARRTVCAANLKGISTGLATYANDNAGWFPIAAHAPAMEVETGRVKYAPGMIGLRRGDRLDSMSGQTTEADTQMSTTRNLWTLVRSGMANPASFVCPTSDDVRNDEDNPQLFWDFQNWNQVSYGYQVPYGKFGQPGLNRDARMVLAADKGPYSAALETGKPHPGVPAPAPQSSPDDWRPWNSPNHGGEGQVALFGDTHAEFLTRPVIGVKNDNIYTRWSTPDGGDGDHPAPRIHGTPPTGRETPMSDTDSLIYP